MNAFNNLIHTLNHDSTRHLAWAIFAPEMIQQPSITALMPELTLQRIHWLKMLDNKPAILESELYLGHSLGRYYESLWHFFFQHDSQYEILAQNLAIRNAATTIGEFDFIIRDRHTDCFIHHEIAVKYYLFYPPNNNSLASDKNNWLGPDSRDTLHKKWTHITQQQIHLSDHVYAKDLLSQLGITQLNKTISLKGCLFSPSGINDTPTGYNKQNTLYHWYNIDDFLSLNNKNNILAFIPKKSWLTCLHSHNSIEITNHKIMTDKVRKTNMPLMAAYIRNDKTGLSEEQRFFIVPDRWP